MRGNCFIIHQLVVFLYSFDAHLVGALQYKTPQLLVRLMESVTPGARYERALDLGCGSGLSGEACRHLVQGELLGVDLSPKMLEVTRKKGIYDWLEAEDIITVMQTIAQKNSGDGAYQLIFCADVLVYIGDLHDFFFWSKQVLCSHGTVVFSTELMDASITNPQGFRLESTGRYTHHPDYLEAKASEIGFQLLKLERGIIRKQGDQEVQGNLVIMRLPS